MKLFSKNSNLYDHDTSTLQTDGQAEGQLALAISHSARLRAVITKVEDDTILPIVVNNNSLLYIVVVVIDTVYKLCAVHSEKFSNKSETLLLLHWATHNVRPLLLHKVTLVSAALTVISTWPDRVARNLHVGSKMQEV